MVGGRLRWRSERSALLLRVASSLAAVITSAACGQQVSVHADGRVSLDVPVRLIVGDAGLERIECQAIGPITCSEALARIPDRIPVLTRTTEGQLVAGLAIRGPRTQGKRLPYQIVWNAGNAKFELEYSYLTPLRGVDPAIAGNHDYVRTGATVAVQYDSETLRRLRGFRTLHATASPEGRGIGLQQATTYGAGNLPPFYKLFNDRYPRAVMWWTLRRASFIAPAQLYGPGAVVETLRPVFSWSSGAKGSQTQTLALYPSADLVEETLLFEVNDLPSSTMAATLPGVSLAWGNTYYWLVTTVDPWGYASSDVAAFTTRNPRCKADLTGDQIVDDADFDRFVIAYRAVDGDAWQMPQNCAASDFNNDGIVDDADYADFAAAYAELLCPS